MQIRIILDLVCKRIERGLWTKEILKDKERSNNSSPVILKLVGVEAKVAEEEENQSQLVEEEEVGLLLSMWIRCLCLN